MTENTVGAVAEIAGADVAPVLTGDAEPYVALWAGGDDDADALLIPAARVPLLAVALLAAAARAESDAADIRSL